MGIEADPGSFRDPLSRVFVARDAVYRGLTDAGAADFAAVEQAPAFAALQEEGKVVRTARDDAVDLPGEWAAILRHEKVPVVSYPYEWSFEMLRDAALLQLEVTRRAVADGIVTKDATAYNIAFRGARPVFLDVGSFEPLRPGSPWPGYRQFCELFLNPLVVQAVAGIPFQAWLRGRLDGIAPGEVVPLLRGRRRLDRRLLVHVVLHARAERRYAGRAGREMEHELRQAGLGPKVLDAQLANLERTVGSLRWGAQASTWSGYGERGHYAEADLAAKDAFVARHVADLGPAQVLDLGANDGRFSRLALEHGAGAVVAVDSDHLVIDRLYRELRQGGETRVLPLVVDLADPSPGLGLRGMERAAFVDRVAPELVLCLAVVHHLAIGRNVPIPLVVDLLADFEAPAVVEVPHHDDPMVQRLLSRKRPGLFDDVGVDAWLAALGRRFDLRDRETLPSGHRTLVRCDPS